MNKVLKRVTKPFRIVRQNLCFRKNNKFGKTVGDRHIVVIESDDWGSIRVPSDEVKNMLNSQGAMLDNEPFTRHDGLESCEDISKIIDAFSSITDKNSRHPVITAFYAVANADFESIRHTGFSEYKRESFLNTSSRYDGDNDILSAVNRAIEKGVFRPELHCYEHLNTKRWLNDLKAGKQDTLKAFDSEMYGLGTNFEDLNPFGYMDAFHHRSEEELDSYDTLISQAVREFKDVFGYFPKAFTAPCYVWNEKLEEYLYNNGIECICGSNYQLIPKKGNYDSFEKNIHFVGEVNKHGIVYLTRNVIFELIYNEKEAHEIAMRQVSAAFHEKKPAIISIHRANFSNRIGAKRDEHLSAICSLLQDITGKWPDVEFMSSYELSELYREERQ